MTRTTLLTLLLAAVAASAKNVDLVTLPARDTVQLTIYNSEDLTLVRERRFVTLKQGSNQLQFSWAGTLIDPTSVEMRPLAHAEEIEIADTIFPGQKPQHLIWNVESRFEGQVLLEVSYFTSGLTWSMDYVAICDPGETRMDLTGHVRVFNQSGEEYENAEIRLIVGNINLVESIAELARRQGIPMPAPESPTFAGMRQRESRRAFDAAESAAKSELRDGAAQIVKEGVSEYFMFSIEGTETIGNGWSKRMQAIEAADAPFEILYRMRAHQYGPRPVRFFLWKNDEEHELGESPLPDGLVRIFRENGQDGLSFLGEQVVRYAPIAAPVEVNLGPDDLVVYETTRRSTERLNFAFDTNGRNEYVVGWDEKTDWTDRIRNYRGKPIRFELHRVWDGDVDYDSELETGLFDYRTALVTLDVGARTRVEYPATVVLHLGRNAKQNRIQLR
jgi:hypothetical protein